MKRNNRKFMILGIILFTVLFIAACTNSATGPSTKTPVINGTGDYQPGRTNNPSGTTDNQQGITNNSAGTSAGTQAGTGSNSGTTTPKTYTIDISNFAFGTPSLNINKGDTVVWTNQDSVPHTVTSDSGSELNSPRLSQGQTYSHTFNTAGTFDYHCSVHPMMTAKVIVN